MVDIVRVYDEETEREYYYDRGIDEESRIYYRTEQEILDGSISNWPSKVVMDSHKLMNQIFYKLSKERQQNISK